MFSNVALIIMKRHPSERGNRECIVRSLVTICPVLLLYFQWLTGVSMDLTIYFVSENFFLVIVVIIIYTFFHFLLKKLSNC